MEYIYDAVGNRLVKKDTAIGDIVYRYNQNDWLLDESIGNVVTTAYTYDNNGNTKTRTIGTEITNYVWDTQNRLMGAAISANGQTQQLAYEYNINGMRTKSTVNGTGTTYLLDENRQYAQVLEEYSSSGIQSRYVYGAELDLLSQTRGTATSFYLQDGHSGVRQLANAAGAITDQYGYDSYGNVIYSAANTQNTYRYRSEQSDPNLGMQYLRARYYDTRSGRFASVDPFEGNLTSSISRHRYIYGSSNPITGFDPSGLYDLNLGSLGAAQQGFTTLEIIAVAIASVALQWAINRSQYQDIYWKGTIGTKTIPSTQIEVGYIDVETDAYFGFAGTWLLIGATEGLNLDNYQRKGADIPPLTYIGMKSPSSIGVGAQAFAGYFGYGIYGNSGTIGGFGLFGFGEGTFANVAPEWTNGGGAVAAGLSIYLPAVVSKPAKGAAKQGQKMFEEFKKRLPWSKN
jgi:RHS repeat-associated protein